MSPYSLVPRDEFVRLVCPNCKRDFYIWQAALEAKREVVHLAGLTCPRCSKHLLYSYEDKTITIG